jgi:hypothetical protein
MLDIDDYKIYNPKCLLCNKRLMIFCKRRYLSFTCRRCVSSKKNKILDVRFKFQVKFITDERNKRRELFSMVRRLHNYKLIYKRGAGKACLFKYDKNNFAYFVMEMPVKLFIKFLNMNENQLFNEINKHLLFI